MGNKATKESVISERVDGVYKQNEDHFKFHLNYNNSWRSIDSHYSQGSIYSVSRPWSRISRRRWRESTLTLPYELSKTAWPVSQLESYFLPEFPVNDSTRDNNFDILQQISQGAFGKVYQVRNLDKNEIFALKVLSKSKVIENNSIKQVKEEVQIQKACGHHAFIVECPLTWQSRKRLFIVSQYLEGGELWNLLDNLGVLPTDIVQLYVAQIALAIDFLHNAGVIYRDLKPENLLLDSDANIKLIDFGLSKWLPYGRTTKTVCGTPKYMAPEISKMAGYGHSVDWWSLGVIACVMMTSKTPILELDNNRLTLPSNIYLNVASRDILFRLLEIEPHKRLRSLRTLGTIAFYKGYDFNSVKEQIVKPKTLLIKHYGEDYNKPKDVTATFDGFDEILIPDNDIE